MSSEEEDLARLMNTLLVRLNRFIGWRRNFTIVVTVLMVLLGLAVWNDSRVQSCDQRQIVTRALYNQAAQLANRDLWLTIDKLIKHPKSNRKAGTRAFDGAITRFVNADNTARSHKVHTCSWF